MPENLNETALVAALTSTSLSKGQKWLVLLLSIAFALLPFCFRKPFPASTRAADANAAEVAAPAPAPVMIPITQEGTQSTAALQT